MVICWCPICFVNVLMLIGCKLCRATNKDVLCSCISGFYFVLMSCFQCCKDVIYTLLGSLYLS
ncbi:uncharacterized protein BYT42DRAFT_586943 [Radiomyces spectabilis]|uniref:uncharacterized protein n=1 Tax=Radiomyces spectabilis TaxID=64574 RepID=UPI00221E4901|nr:uncharacterized protein BYT42DRAFT_586943 [Radiomyces spectabilis]KAI8367635.1 hypothetical protein BYT42DRAFT_586943 [Radiomyces spectabilis]